MTSQDNTIKITKGAVATCYYEAKKIGVKSAMTLYKSIRVIPQFNIKCCRQKIL
jgi:hypothetical protein